MDKQMIGENHFLSTELKFRRSLIKIIRRYTRGRVSTLHIQLFRVMFSIDISTKFTDAPRYVEKQIFITGTCAIKKPRNLSETSSKHYK